MTKTEEHTVASIKEQRGDKTVYRGRCSCGATTHMHYSNAEFAMTALRRTHIADLKGRTT